MTSSIPKNGGYWRCAPGHTRLGQTERQSAGPLRKPLLLSRCRVTSPSGERRKDRPSPADAGGGGRRENADGLCPMIRAGPVRGGKPRADGPGTVKDPPPATAGGGSSAYFSPASRPVQSKILVGRRRGGRALGRLPGQKALEIPVQPGVQGGAGLHGAEEPHDLTGGLGYSLTEAAA